MGKQVEAAVDAVFRGKAFGGLAARLLKAGMNAQALRTNDTLRKDEWKELDKKVVEISRIRLVGASDLIGRGLVYNLTNGLGTTVLETENVSDFEDADMNMDGATPGAKDRPEFDIGYLPLPIVHKGFDLSIRVLNASRRMGQPLDATMAGLAAKKVSEKIEEILFVGASTYTFGGGTLYGYLDHPNRNTVSLGTNWDASGATPLANVLDMKQASITAKHYGPWMLYIPTAYDHVLDDDYSTSYPNASIRNRIKQVAGIVDIKVADKLTANNVVLVEMAEETARMVVGMQPTTVEWESQGGMITHYKVMAIMVPQVRADQDGNSGIVHLS